MIKMAVAQKMENKFCVNGLWEKNLQKKKKKRTDGEKGKRVRHIQGVRDL